MPTHECKLQKSSMFSMLWNLRTACSPTIPIQIAIRFSSMWINFWTGLPAANVLYAIIPVHSANLRIISFCIFNVWLEEKRREWSISYKQVFVSNVCKMLSFVFCFPSFSWQSLYKKLRFQEELHEFAPSPDRKTSPKNIMNGWTLQEPKNKHKKI